MGRIWKQWTDKPVSEYEVAPHRYLWSGAITPTGEVAKELCLCDTWSEAKANYSYREGEVVYLQQYDGFVRALIVAVLVGHRDRFGDRAEAYRVVRETKSGKWSKLWETAHPGFIQRGYKNAGLAPDVRD